VRPRLPEQSITTPCVAHAIWLETDDLKPPKPVACIQDKALQKVKKDIHKESGKDSVALAIEEKNEQSSTKEGGDSPKNPY